MAACELAAVAGGTRLRLRVKPAMRTNEIVGVTRGAIKVFVAAAPDKGKANKAVLRLLGRVLDVAPTTIELLHGHTGQDKILLVPLPPEQVAQRLSARDG